MTEFTPYASAFGGVLVGIAAIILLSFQGRIAGISGMVSRLLPPYTSKSSIRTAAGFVIGIILAPIAYMAITGMPVLQTVSSNYPLLVIAGLLVGFGAVLGNGCTSGHAVCGISRLSARSIIATIIFMITAIVTVYLTRHVIG